MLRSLDKVLQLEIHAFFDYIKTIRYGYRDRKGCVHVMEVSDDYSKQEECFAYVFSSPEEVVKDRCGWCWDVANLIVCYCRAHGLEYKSYFMEYCSETFHQTHTQVFVHYDGLWYEAPDNSSPVTFGSVGFSDLQKCVLAFSGEFVGYLKSVLQGDYDEKYFLLKEYSCEIRRGISDGEYLALVRGDGGTERKT